MNTKHQLTDIQDRVDELAQQFSRDAAVNTLLNPDDLKEFFRRGLAELLSTAIHTEREFHLQDHPEDRANGHSPQRELRVGTLAVPLQVPRTRQGFYPALLPKHQRQLPQQYHELLHTVLLQATSFRAALRTLQSMGLGYRPDQLETLLAELDQQAKTFFTRPLHPDWLFLFIDAKVIHLKDEHDQVKKAVHFLVVGVNMQGYKELLTSQIFWGNEVIDAWRSVIISLKNRGLTRALFLVTDDFSGVTTLISSLLPNSDHQLCTVHLFRNALRHLNENQYADFKTTWKEIYASSSPDTARSKLLALLERLRPNHPSYVQHLEKRTDQLLSFMKYPTLIRSTLRSTNLAEGLNNIIENVRRNAGGHFHSEREARIKLLLVSERLGQTKWSRPDPRIATNIQTLNHMFLQRFEDLPN